jgi:hypothetical protein
VTGSTQAPIGEAQRELTERVRHRLRDVGAQFIERVIRHPVEATVAFELRVREPERLTADIAVSADGFWFTANGAALHLEMQDAGNDAGAWVELCDRTIHAILTHDLRIRTRRTFLGRRAGVVWVPVDGASWNGEFFAWLGWGQEQRFGNWIGSPPPSHR